MWTFSENIIKGSQSQNVTYAPQVNANMITPVFTNDSVESLTADLNAGNIPGVTGIPTNLTEPLENKKGLFTTDNMLIGGVALIAAFIFLKMR